MSIESPEPRAHDDHHDRGQSDLRSEASPDRSLELALVAMHENGPYAYTVTRERSHAESTSRGEGSRADRVVESLTTGELRGILDLEGQRSIGHREGFSLIEIDDTAWAGRPGKKVGSVTPAPSSWRLAPLAVIRALRSPLAVEDDGIVSVSGRPVRVLRVEIEDATASVALGGPAHRIVIESDDHLTSLELEHTVARPGEIDWDRLPAAPIR